MKLHLLQEYQEYDSFTEGEPAGARRRTRSSNMATGAAVPVKSKRVTSLLEFIVVLVGLSLVLQFVMLVMSFLSFTSPPSSSNSVQGSASALGPDQGSGDPQESSGWTEWKPLTACSATCGGGIYKVERERNCTISPCHNDSSIMTERETRGISCNPNGCPVDGGWSKWGCTNGTIVYERTCSNPPPAHGGKPCQEPEPGSAAANRTAAGKAGDKTGWKCAKKGEIHNAYKMGSKMHQSPCERWCASMGAQMPTILTQEEDEETQRYRDTNIATTLRNLRSTTSGWRQEVRRGEVHLRVVRRRGLEVAK